MVIFPLGLFQGLELIVYHTQGSLNHLVLAQLA